MVDLKKESMRSNEDSSGNGNEKMWIEREKERGG